MNFWILLPAAVAIVLIAFSLGYSLSRRQMKTHQKNRRIAGRPAGKKMLREETNHREKLLDGRQTEQKLRGYIQLMDTLINTIPNPIYYRGTDGTFIGCNLAFAGEVMGLTRDRIIGYGVRGIADRVPPELVDVLNDDVQKVNASHEINIFEASVPCADGQVREFLFTTTPMFEADGAISGSISVMIDLTEKNRAASNRMQQEKFEGVLETAGAVCHELNQPLQVLSGYAELVMGQAPGQDLSSQLSRQIITQVERMAEITQKLQSITRYETMSYGENSRIIDIHKSSIPSPSSVKEI